MKIRIRMKIIRTGRERESTQKPRTIRAKGERGKEEREKERKFVTRNLEQFQQ